MEQTTTQQITNGADPLPEPDSTVPASRGARRAQLAGCAAGHLEMWGVREVNKQGERLRPYSVYREDVLDRMARHALYATDAGASIQDLRGQHPIPLSA